MPCRSTRFDRRSYRLLWWSSCSQKNSLQRDRLVRQQANYSGPAKYYINAEHRALVTSYESTWRRHRNKLKWKVSYTFRFYCPKFDPWWVCLEPKAPLVLWTSIKCMVQIRRLMYQHRVLEMRNQAVPRYLLRPYSELEYKLVSFHCRLIQRTVTREVALLASRNDWLPTHSSHYSFGMTLYWCFLQWFFTLHSYNQINSEEAQMDIKPNAGAINQREFL